MMTENFPEKYKNFVLKKKIPIDEIQSILFEIEHVPTQATIFHVAHEDDENLFSLSFKTYPENSNGVAHILEHTVLCGSKKFPIKDPFFAMTRRSLNTFMNAMTGMDFTCYPAATQNKKDFYHLLDVYIDAVFNPILDEKSFLQEGHRLEFQSKTNIKSPLTIQGIVYNEMKGSLNSPESRLYKELYKALLPNLPYRFNSGGDPEEIPNLTYQELKEFHAKYYHPSRCVFFFYGNLPLEGHLDFLESTILSHSTKVDPIPNLPLQPRFKEKKIIECAYPVSAITKDQDFIAIAFLTTSIRDQVEFLALSLLEEILMESDASFLKNRLQQSHLLVQADSFIDGEMSEIPFVFVMRGTNVTHAEKIEKILFEELNNFISKPISVDLIQAALHQLEIDRLEITDENGPYGLSLFMRSILIMQHGANPEEGLFVHQLFEQLKQKIKDPTYLPSIIKKYFLNNPHRVIIKLKADLELEKKEKEKEFYHLKDIKEKLTEKELKRIVEKTKELELFQKKQESVELNVLPELQIEDIDLSVKHFPLEVIKKNQLTVSYHQTWTNGFIYADLLYDLCHLDKKEWPALKFLLSILTELGAADRSYEENLNLIQAKTGGIQAYFQLITHIKDPNYLKPVVGIRGKCLIEHSEAFFQIVKDTLLEPKINDPERIKELILQTYTYLRDKLNRSSLGYCIKEALDGSTLYNSLNNAMSGIPYYRYIENLAQRVETDLAGIIEEFLVIKKKIFHFNKPELILSIDQEGIEKLKEKEFYGLSKISNYSYSPWMDLTKLNRPKNAVIETSSPVAFVCEAFHVFGIDDPLSPALTLATYIMESTCLHPLIREQGGAYGASATYQPMVGNFYFHTYRDPNVSQSFDAFHTTIETLLKTPISDQALKDAKFEFIQEFDAPITPGMRGQTAYFYEKTERTLKFRESYKKRILKVTQDDVKQAIAKALLKKQGTKVFACSLAIYQNEKDRLEERHLNFDIIKIIKNEKSE